LGTALHVTDSQSREFVHQTRGRATLRSTASQLAKIAVSPGINESSFDQCQSLGISTPARHLNNTLADQGLDAFGCQLCEVISMSQTAVLSETPRVQFTG
jgi:hypothetical protein